MKKCTVCKIEKEYTEFHRNCRNKDGYSSSCKKCMLKYKDKSKKDKDDLNLHGVTEDDYITMYELLSYMGYDIYGNIAKQFAEKHNLKYRSRKSRLSKNNSGPQILEKLQRENLITDK